MRNLLVAILFLAVGCGRGRGEIHNLPDPDAGVDGVRDAASVDAADAGARDARRGADVGRPDTPEPLPELRDDIASASWRDKVQAVVDSQSLDEYFGSVGYTLPVGADAYAVRIGQGAGYPSHEFFEAGGGAFDVSFWPASTIKLLSALGALEWVYRQGFTGDARIDWDSGFGDQLRSIYERAIGVSSNIDYDRTLRAAGWDFMNAEFLTEERGFPRTVITSSYASVEVRNPGGYTLSEDGQSKYVAGRPGVGDYGRNDTDLYELTEGVRRVMLHAEVPEDERFRIDPSDVTALQIALCGATPSFFAAGAEQALGSTPVICHKPGWVPDNECLDHGLVTAPDGARFLLAGSVPYSSNCPTLAPLARRMLDFLQQAPTRVPMQPDYGDVTVQVDSDTVSVLVPGADMIVLWEAGEEVARTTLGDRGHFVVPHAVVGTVLLSVAAYKQGTPSAFRAGFVTGP